VRSFPVHPDNQKLDTQRVISIRVSLVCQVVRF
jgi:hypothetical protein